MKLSPPARELVSTIRRFRLDDQGLSNACYEARRHLGLRRRTGRRKLPQLLSEASLTKYFDALDRTEDLQHQIMLRIFLYTGIRVSELCNIRMTDVDLHASKIFIDQGKGEKDRYVLFRDDFRLPLSAYMQSHPENEYLFESTHKTKYTRQRIGQIVKEYAHVAGLTERVYPHLLRHQALTWLTREGLPDAMIQLISGHASKTSLEIYQHVGLADVREGYQRAMGKIGV